MNNFPVLLVCHLDGDVTVALDDPVATPLGARPEALQRRRLVDHDQRNLQLVDIGTVVVLRIGDRRLEHFPDHVRRLLRRVLEGLQRGAYGLATDHVRDQPALLRRDPGIAKPGCYLHLNDSYLDFRSPEWLLKVRVWANSPSLCPSMFSEMSTGTC